MKRIRASWIDQCVVVVQYDPHIKGRVMNGMIHQKLEQYDRSSMYNRNLRVYVQSMFVS